MTRTAIAIQYFLPILKDASSTQIKGTNRVAAAMSKDVSPYFELSKVREIQSQPETSGGRSLPFQSANKYGWRPLPGTPGVVVGVPKEQNKKRLARVWHHLCANHAP